MYIDKDKILGWLGNLLMIIGVGLYGLGIYHSATKHPNESDVLRWTPFALYRGVEIFWHDDFAGVNWANRLKDDGVACVYFISYSMDKSNNPLELNRKLEEFSKEINKYPNDKLEVLKTFSKLYAEYFLTITSDLKNALSNYYQYDQKYVSYSGKVVEIENKLKNYLPPDKFEEMIKPARELYSKVKENVEKDAFGEEDKEKFLNNYEDLIGSMKITFSTVYKKLFNEEMII